MELLRAEKIVDVKDASNRMCRCGQKMELVRTVFEIKDGRLTHLFECRCGNRVWDE